jgi:Aminotransferase class I and II
MYDSYVPMARHCGATPVCVKLNLPDWSVPHTELASAFGARTKLILVNSPHNPTGRVFSDADLAFIAELCVKHNAYAVLDEVGCGHGCDCRSPLAAWFVMGCAKSKVQVELSVHEVLNRPVLCGENPATIFGIRIVSVCLFSVRLPPATHLPRGFR